jgi:hypothetical protein
MGQWQRVGDVGGDGVSITYNIEKDTDIEDGDDGDDNIIVSMNGMHVDWITIEQAIALHKALSEFLGKAAAEMGP